jgi:hypothetical protein
VANSRQEPRPSAVCAFLPSTFILAAAWVCLGRWVQQRLLQDPVRSAEKQAGRAGAGAEAPAGVEGARKHTVGAWGAGPGLCKGHPLGRLASSRSRGPCAPQRA